MSRTSRPRIAIRVTGEVVMRFLRGAPAHSNSDQQVRGSDSARCRSGSLHPAGGSGASVFDPSTGVPSSSARGTAQPAAAVRRADPAHLSGAGLAEALLDAVWPLTWKWRSPPSGTAGRRSPPTRPRCPPSGRGTVPAGLFVLTRGPEQAMIGVWRRRLAWAAPRVSGA